MTSVKKYKQEIEQDWDWKYVVASAKDNPQPSIDSPDDEMFGYFYLGTVMNLAPSGKYYMPWCSNFTAKEAEDDERWYAALDAIAEKHGGWIENGEGDPCDIFFVVGIDQDEEAL